MPFTKETASAAGKKSAESRQKGLPKKERDHKTEAERERIRARRFTAKLRVDEANTLQAQLDREGLKFTQWVRKHIETPG